MRKNNEADWHDKSIAAFVRREQLWRAKESLQSRVRTNLFNTGLYEDYGRVLLLMGDLPEAGKYLFLCGERRPEYEEAIELFLLRYGRQGWPSLIQAFPKRARNVSLQSFPQSVQAELSKLEYPPERGASILPYKKPGLRQLFILLLCNIGCWFFGLLLVFSCVLGFAQIAQFLFN